MGLHVPSVIQDSEKCCSRNVVVHGYWTVIIGGQYGRKILTCTITVGRCYESTDDTCNKLINVYCYF